MAFLLSILIIQINVLYAHKNKMCGYDWKNVPNYDTPADRIYIIGCVEEIWDYAPTGKNLITGTNNIYILYVYQSQIIQIVRV